MSTTTSPPPLADARIVGMNRNVYRSAPDAPAQPGGTCWHCGQGIMVEVLVRFPEANDAHREYETVGTTCAERVGLDADELRRHLAALYADERNERRAAVAADRRAAWEAAEAKAEAEHGPHGSAGRSASGCTCVPCLDARPHGTAWHLNNGCRCGACVGYALDSEPERWYTAERTVLVSLGEGTIPAGVVAEARTVSTRYGYRWRIDSTDAWLPNEPARRSTLANKGFTEADAVVLVERRGRKGWSYDDVAISCPLVDRWGVGIPRP